MFGCLAFVHIPKEKQKKLDYRATPGIFIGYSISPKQYFIYDPLGNTLHRSRDVVFSEGRRYTVLNAADDAIFNAHFNRDVIEEPIPTPIEKQPTKHQMKEPLDDDSLLDLQKPNQYSQELDCLERSLGEAWKLPAEGSCRNRPGKDILGDPAQSALEDEEFEDMIPIRAVAAISDNHEKGIGDPKTYKVAT